MNQYKLKMNEKESNLGTLQTTASQCFRVHPHPQTPFLPVFRPVCFRSLLNSTNSQWGEGGSTVAATTTNLAAAVTLNNTHTHTRTHARTHERMHTRTHARTHARTHTQRQTDRQTNRQTERGTERDGHRERDYIVHTRERAHTRMHAGMRARASHIHTYK